MRKLGANSFATLVLTLNPRYEHYDILETLRPIISSMDELFWAFADERRAVLLGFWAENQDLETAVKDLRECPAVSYLEMQVFPLSSSHFTSFMDFGAVINDAVGRPGIKGSPEEGKSRSTMNVGSSSRTPRTINLTANEKTVLMGLIEHPELVDEVLAERVGLRWKTVALARRKFDAKGMFKTIILPDPIRFGNIMAIWTAGGEFYCHSVHETGVSANDLENHQPETPEDLVISSKDHRYSKDTITAQNKPESPDNPSTPAATGRYIPTATLFGLDRSSSMHADKNSKTFPSATFNISGGEPRPMRTTMVLPQTHPVLKKASPAQRGRSARSQNTIMRPGTSKYVPTAVFLGIETDSDLEDEPSEPEIPDSELPGFDFAPEITSDPIPDKANGGSAVAGQQPSAETNAPARKQTAHEPGQNSDKFSLGDLETTLAMSIRPRSAGTEKPLTAQKIARSGTFVWDFEKLGPPRHTRANRQTIMAPDSSASPFPQAAIVPAPIKRGRGRPRKNPIVAMPEVVPKRRLGRPPKIRVDIPEIAPIKRKRGRPRKNPIVQAPEIPVKRRRGRPPKNTQTKRHPPTNAIPMTMERFVRNISASTPAMPAQTDLPIVLDVTSGEYRFVLGLFQNQDVARRTVHHLRNGVFLDGRRMKQFETRRLAVLKEINFGTVARKLLGLPRAADE